MLLSPGAGVTFSTIHTERKRILIHGGFSEASKGLFKVTAILNEDTFFKFAFASTFFTAEINTKEFMNPWNKSDAHF